MRTSCRDTCSGCRRPRCGPSTAARRGDSSDRQARRSFRSRRDRARSASREWCAPASCRRSIRDSRPRRTRNCRERFHRPSCHAPAWNCLHVQVPSLVHESAPENGICLDTLSSGMDNPAMDWRDWELFCEVVAHGGFSAAARVLGHPKSSLSAAVQRLESQLGLRLIERTTRHLRLTDAGETIYRRVQPQFIALHETKTEALAMSSAVAGTLRIKSPYEFGAHHAGPVACELMARYPDLTIRIDVEHEIVNPIAENYDIVFAMLEAPLPSAGIVIRRVFSLERGLFAAPALLERCGEPHSLEELAGLPLLAGPSDA